MPHYPTRSSECRLPITVPKPAHARFIPRGSSDSQAEIKAPSATRARQLMWLHTGDPVLGFRHRAIIKFFLYSGLNIALAEEFANSDRLTRMVVDEVNIGQSHDTSTVRTAGTPERPEGDPYLRPTGSCKIGQSACMSASSSAGGQNDGLDGT